MKKCGKCREVKDWDEYHNSKSTSDGVHGICKPCARQYQKEYQSKNREITRIKNAKYYENRYKDKKRKYKEKNNPALVNALLAFSC